MTQLTLKGTGTVVNTGLGKEVRASRENIPFASGIILFSCQGKVKHYLYVAVMASSLPSSSTD
jgi:hypothetical protein